MGPLLASSASTPPARGAAIGQVIGATLGVTVVCACGAVSLVAFPLDDIWHRIFGQDVTLWGPTHLLLIGGASFSILGVWILHVEGERAAGGVEPTLRAFTRFRDAALVGS